MQLLYNEEQRKKLQNTTTVRTILKSLNAMSVARIFCPDLHKLRLLCKLQKYKKNLDRYHSRLSPEFRNKRSNTKNFATYQRK